MYRIKKIDGVINKYDVYEKALKWENERFNPEELGMEWLLGDIVAGYKNNELMAMGIVRQYHTSGEKDNCSILSIRTSPSCNDNELIAKLLKSMLSFSKDALNAKTAYIKLLKKNEKVLEEVEEHGFDFKEFDEETITFQKKLINKGV